MDNLVSIATVPKSLNEKSTKPPAKKSNGAEIIFFTGVRYERTIAKNENRSSEESATNR